MTATDRSFDAIVERCKREILADIASGRVPASVGSFSELHDHVDANEYGGACETDEDGIGWWDMDRAGHEDVVRFWNAVQDRVDWWLRAGRKEPKTVLVHLNVLTYLDADTIRKQVEELIAGPGRQGWTVADAEEV